MRILINLKHPVIVFLAVVILGVGGGIVLFERHFEDRFFPGIYLGGVNVSDMPYQEVRDHADQVAQALDASGIQIIFTSGGSQKTITIPKRSTGLTPDVVVEYFTVGDYRKAISDAFAVGHTGSVWNRLQQQFDLISHHYSGEYGITPLPDSIKALIERDAHELLAQPQDARFTATATKVTMIPEKAGEKIDVDASVLAAQMALRSMQTNRLQAHVASVPAAVTAAKLEPIRDFVLSLASSAPLKLLYNDHVVYLGLSLIHI